MKSLNLKRIVSLALCWTVIFVVTTVVQTTKAQTQNTQEAKTFTFKNVSVIDVTGGTVQPNMTVIVSGNRISDMGKTGSIEIPAGAMEIDASGKFLIPGLWDMHLHKSWDYFGLLIANGVTGIRDMGSPDLSLAEIADLRQKVREGQITGPRIVAAGPQVISKSSNDRRVKATTPERGRKVVDSLSAAGADFIKVYNLSRETFFAIADQAEKRGIPIAGHLSPEVTLAEAGKAGQQSIEHYTITKPFGLIPLCSSHPDKLRRLIRKTNSLEVPLTDSVHIAHRRRGAKLTAESYDKERCRRETQRLADYETWHTPTLMMGMMHPRLHDDQILHDPKFRYMPPLRQEWYEWKRSLMVANFSENLLSDYQSTIGRIVANLHRGGVGILAGTDNGGFYGFGLHEEMALLVEAGLSPLEALQTATLNPAKYFGRSDELGTVEPGKLADLVLLDANPLENIQNTTKIRAVVADGRLFSRDDLDRFLENVAERNSGLTIATVIYRTIEAEGIEAARKYHRELLKSHPDSVLFNENSLNSLGYRLLQQKRVNEAVAVFEMNVVAYPNAPNPYDSRGDGYRRAGQFQKAKASYEKAVELAEQQKDSDLEYYRSKLNKFTKMMEMKNLKEN